MDVFLTLEKTMVVKFQTEALAAKEEMFTSVRALVYRTFTSSEGPTLKATQAIQGKETRTMEPTRRIFDTRCHWELKSMKLKSKHFKKRMLLKTEI